VAGNPLLLLTVNALELAVGAAVLLALGLAGTRRALVARIGLAYATGLATVGILSATLALVGVVLNLAELAVLGLGALALALFVRRPGPDASSFRPGPGGLVAGVVALVTGALLALAATTFTVKPLFEWDGWAIWSMKAQALYDFGGAGPVLTSAIYSQSNYPILLPALEAVDYRAMGTADTTVVHLQFALFALAFAGGLFGLLWRRVPSALIALTGLAILAAPSVLALLGTSYADVPLAFFIALGVVALARWLVDEDTAMLPLAALFLAAGTLTKNEGTVFAAAALLPAIAYAATRDRRRCRHLLIAAAGVVAASLPWRIFTAVHHLSVGSIHLADFVRPHLYTSGSSRLEPSARALIAQLGPDRWAALVSLTLLALVAGFVARRRLLVAYAVGWLVLSFGGLLLNYWLSPLPLAWYLQTSAARVVATLVIGGAALAPLLAADAWASAIALFARTAPRLGARPQLRSA